MLGFFLGYGVVPIDFVVRIARVLPPLGLFLVALL
jgi:hypothetical protein